MTYTKYLTFCTKEKKQFVNITRTCQEIVNESGVKEGFMLVSAMHITAGIWVNDNEYGILNDAMEFLEELAPTNKDYRHHNTGEVNGHAHLKNLLMHHQVILPITKGQLDFGPWQTVFYAEFDGQRNKRVIFKIIGE